MRDIDDMETGTTECEAMQARNSAEILRARAYLLSGVDRTLLEMYLEHGNKFRQIGRLMGWSHTSVGRRIRRVILRLMDDTYALCMRNRDEFNGRELVLIKDYFIAGLPMEQISRNRHVTLYRVKAVVRKARRHAAVERTRKRGKRT